VLFSEEIPLCFPLVIGLSVIKSMNVLMNDESAQINEFIALFLVRRHARAESAQINECATLFF
jgi:hypothetical protein